MKERVGLAMMEGAERDGLVDHDTTIVEYTGGSTGPALALVCRAKGYRCKRAGPESSRRTGSPTGWTRSS